MTDPRLQEVLLPLRECPQNVGHFAYPLLPGSVVEPMEEALPPAVKPDGEVDDWTVDSSKGKPIGAPDLLSVDHHDLRSS